MDDLNGFDVLKKIKRYNPNTYVIMMSGQNDIANAVIFLDSENASYINGHNLVVDGGVISSVIAQLPRE